MAERYLIVIHFGRDGRIARYSVDELLSSEVMKMSQRCFPPNTSLAEMPTISRGLLALLLSVPKMKSAVDLLMAGTCCYCARSPFKIFATLWTDACS
ncbi:hypothetical protein Nepgr_017518 [Nepenthes gracilis]|uniref:Uncharacterized protein n=1 Tax=Nepenthes gracilis TaxID=150966 RepID=A0AAD3SSH9_NEPGR|nr:hypothetical protein Nepgr_017518 [Nepenthes gracilis]